MQPRFLSAISLQEFADEIAAAWPNHQEDRIDVPEDVVNSEHEFIVSQSFEDYMDQLGFNELGSETLEVFMNNVKNGVKQFKLAYEAARDMLIEESQESVKYSYPVFPILWCIETEEPYKEIDKYIQAFVRKTPKFPAALAFELGETELAEQVYERRSVDLGGEMVIAQVQMSDEDRRRINKYTEIGQYFIGSLDFAENEDYGNGAFGINPSMEAILKSVLDRQAGAFLTEVVTELLQQKFYDNAMLSGEDVGMKDSFDSLVYEYVKENEEEVVQRIAKDNESAVEEILRTEVEYQAKWRWKKDLDDAFGLKNASAESSFAEIGADFINGIRNGQIDVYAIYEEAEMFNGGDFKDVYYVIEGHSADNDVEVSMPQFNEISQQITLTQPSQVTDIQAQPVIEPDVREERVMNANKAEDELEIGMSVLYHGEPVTIHQVGEGYLRFEIEDKNGRLKWVEKAELQPFDSDPLRIQAQHLTLAASGTGYADYQEKNTDQAGTGMSGNVVSTHTPDVAQHSHGGEEKIPVPSLEYEETMKRNREIQHKRSLGMKKIDAIASDIVSEINQRLKTANISIEDKKNSLRLVCEYYRVPKSMNVDTPEGLIEIIRRAEADDSFFGRERLYAAATAKDILAEVHGRNAQVNTVGDTPKPPVPPSPLPQPKQVGGVPIGGQYSNEEQQQKEEDAEQAQQSNIAQQQLQQQKTFQDQTLEQQKKNIARLVEGSKLKMIFGTTPNFETPSFSDPSQIDDDNSQLSGSDHGRKVFLGERYEDDKTENATFPKLDKDLQPNY